MKFVCSTLLLAVASSGESQEPLALIQQRAAKTQDAASPSVDKVLQQPADTVKSLNAHLDTLKAHLDVQQQQADSAFQSAKAEYEQTLTTKVRENHKLESAITQLRKEIDELRESNKAHRQSSIATKTEVKRLEGELQSFQGSLATASEFAEQTATSLGDNLKASELHVLDELDEKDASEEHQSSHKSRLSAIGNMAMLQTVDGGDAHLSAQDLLQAVESTMNDLVAKNTKSLSALKDAFDAKLNKIEDRHKQLIDEQITLEAKKTSELDMQEKLVSAEQKLKATKQQLAQRLQALHKFAERLGKQEQKASLLQTSPSKRSLPKVSEILKAPKSLIEKMDSQIADLEASIKSTHDDNEEDLTKQKENFESKLKNQRKENAAAKKEIEDISNEIEALVSSNADLRKQATSLRDQNEALSNAVKKMKSNIALAEEFTAETLRSSASLLEEAPQLAVLAELDDADAKEEHSKAHAEHLRQVSGEVAFMQTGVTKPAAATELLESLMAQLTALNSTHMSSQESLKAEFEKQFKKGEDKHDELLKAKHELKAKRKAAQEMHEKLQGAVEHLTSVHADLVKRHHSLAQFMRKLSKA